MSAVEPVSVFTPRPVLHQSRMRPIVVDAAVGDTSVHAIDDQMVALVVRDTTTGEAIVQVQFDSATSRMLADRLTAVNNR